jgi:hypothetical protein
MDRHLRSAQVVSMVLPFVLVLGACNSEYDPVPAPEPPATTSSQTAAVASANSGASKAGTNISCVDDQVRECRIDLAQQGTVHNCLAGLQLCKDGAWGPCLSNDELAAQLENN